MSDWRPPSTKYPPPPPREPPLHQAARLGNHDAIRSLIASGEAIDALFNIRLDPGARPRWARVSIAGASQTVVELQIAVLTWEFFKSG